MRKLRTYQQDVYNKIKQDRSHALFLEQGLGKTQIILHEYNQDDNCKDLIVIGHPNGLQTVWEEQIEENEMKEFVLSWCGKLNKVKRKIEQFKKIKDGKILIINIEVFQSFSNVFLNECLPSIMRSIESCMLVIDQSACIKNQKSKRAKILKQFFRNNNSKIVKRRILDGDPCSGGLQELYSQFDFLDPKIINCKSYTAFKNYYCIVDFFGNIDRNNYNNEEDFYDRIKPHATWLQAKDCLDLPDLIHCYDFFSISQDEKRMLKRLETENIFNKKNDDIEFDDEFDENIIHKLTKLMYQQQVCSGRCEAEHKIKSAKLVALFDLIEKIPKAENVVIFVNNHFEIKLITTEMMKRDWKFNEYSGRNVGDRKEEMKEFKDGKSRFLIGTQSAMGKGFTLTNATRVIFYSRHYSYRLYFESLKRVHRQTQKNTVFVHDLISTETIERKIVETLQNKKDLLELARENTQ